MTRFILSILMGLLPGLAFADDQQDLVGALSETCVAPLEQGMPMVQGLTAAPDAMAAKLLNGKDATLWRHANPKIVILAHNSGNTCEVMGLGLDMGAVSGVIRDWAAEAGYTVAEGENMDLPTGGGAYLVRALDEGFLQIFVHFDTPRKFIGISAGRVEDSAQAREVLGE